MTRCTRESRLRQFQGLRLKGLCWLDGETAHVQAVAVHTFSIGRTLDTSDDMARLMLVTHYAGSKSVKVYADSTGEDTEDLVVTRASDGTLTTLHDVDARRSLSSLSAGTTSPARPDAADGLSHEDVVADGAKAKEVFSYDVRWH